VGELPLNVQTKLLKVLEQKTLRRLGGVKETKVDVRIVAATNRDLKQESRDGRFRADLFYRLNVATIVLPPLRSRPDDIRGLARFFFDDLCGVFQKKLRPLSKEILNALVNYSWPGNVRELKNVLERAVLYSKGQVLTLKDLPAEIFEKPSITVGSEQNFLSRDEAEKINIEKVLKTFKNNKTKVAKHLKVSRTTLQSKIKKYKME
jgi:transcriptional regulator with PAS, ATPase and Fis domain